MHNIEKQKINITSGDCFNDYIKEKYNENFIPFKEAMIDGPIDKDLFSSNFNQLRAKHHNTSINEYLNHMKEFYSFLDNINKYDEITLWFGTDTFCVINMLTILAYLDFNKYNDKIYIVLIDDYSKQIIRNKELIYKDNYYNKFISLVIDQNQVSFYDINLNQASFDYLNLHNDDGEIAILIKDNKDSLTKRELVDFVWDKTRKYGLGDIQVYKLIEKYTNYKF